MKKVKNVSVEFITAKGKEATREYKYEVDYFTTLGRNITINHNSTASVNKKGFKVEFFEETVNVVINIGNSHSADLIMSKRAYMALKRGQSVEISTLESFFKTKVFSKKKGSDSCQTDVSVQVCKHKHIMHINSEIGWLCLECRKFSDDKQTFS